MDQQLLQRTRYLLQIRFSRIRRATRGNYSTVVNQTMKWLENHPIMSSVIAYLDDVPGDHHLEFNLLRTHKPDSSRYFYLITGRTQSQENEPNYKGYTANTIEEHASACLQLVRLSTVDNNFFWFALASYLAPEKDYGRYDEALDVIKDNAVKDLYEYIDEALDSFNTVNGLLRKYKQRCEWFQQEELQEISENGYAGKTGERALAVHLQEFIFDQSIEYVIEPSTARGEPDFVLRDSNGQITIIDAKLIKDTSGVARRIAEGFNQVAIYCDVYNEQIGFLAVFVNADITIFVDVEQDGPFRYFKIGSYTIYYIEINIAEHPSASKAGKAKRIRITADQLTEQLQEIAEETDQGQ